MSSDNKNMIYTARDIEQYLSGDMTPMQMHAMEKAALDDPFLAEAMEGYEGMKDKQWTNQLVALRQQIADKGAVAKVIPLHKSKNKRWKAIAAIFILGAGTALTFLLIPNDKPEKNDPIQIAQNITASKDTALPNPQNTISVTPVNPSISSTATTAKETNSNPGNEMTEVVTADQLSGNITTAPGAPVVKSSGSNMTLQVNEPVPTKPAAAMAGNNAPKPNNDVESVESILAERKNASGKVNKSITDDVGRQKNQAVATAKKEQDLNNFFTAQVLSKDNSPLPFTNISIKKDNFGTYADIKGMVRLVSSDSLLNIEVRSVGYLPRTFLLRSGQPQTRIILEEDEEAMKDRTVVINKGANTNRKSRRATMISDSAVNVEPADGWENYNTYVANNLDIPEEMLKQDFPGVVELTFDVKANGTISNIRVNKSLGAEYDEAAKRLLLEGPQWKVKKGKKTSASVKVQF
jgi:hypothetical protein